MATTTGWLGEQEVFYIQSGTYSTWIASNVYISSATHSGNTVTVSGTVKLYIRCSWSSSSPVAYYGDPITVTPRGGSAILIKDWTSTTSMDFYKDQEIGSVDFTTSYTESASSTTSTFSVYYKDTRRDDWVNTTLSWSTSVDPGYTAPSTPTVTIGTKSINSIAVTYGTSSFGYPSSGNVYLYGGISSSPTTQITSKTTTGNSSYTNGSLASNTKYYYRSRANNGQMNSGYSTEKTAVTLAATPTVSVGSISGNDVTINYSTVADGGFYDKTIEYSTDGGTTWQTGATVTGGSAQTGSFVIDNLPSGDNSVQIRTTTTSGSDTPITITISIPTNVKFYGAVRKIVSIGSSSIVSRVVGSYTQPAVASVDLSALKTYLNGMGSLARYLNAGKLIKRVDVVIEKLDTHSWKGSVYIYDSTSGSSSLTYTTKSGESRADIVSWLSPMGFTATSDAYSDASSVMLDNIEYESKSKEVKKLYGSVSYLYSFTGNKNYDPNDFVASFDESAFVQALYENHPEYAEEGGMDFSTEVIRVIWTSTGNTWQLAFSDVPSTSGNYHIIANGKANIESYGFTFNSPTGSSTVARIVVENPVYKGKTKRITKLYGSVNGLTALCYEDVS